MIIKDAQKFADKFFANYMDFYDAEGDYAEAEVARYTDMFDVIFNGNSYFRKAVTEFVKFRKEFLTSDRECASFVKTAEEFGIC